jgi:hypothetical protein
MNIQTYDFVVFSHLRWNFVYQRPQHILSRLAQSYNILFVEEPFQPNSENENTSSIHQVLPNLSVFNTHAYSIDATLNLLKEKLGNQTIEIAWFYSPSFVNALNIFSFDKVVFDCMDELTLFKNAPQSLIEQEKNYYLKVILFSQEANLFIVPKKNIIIMSIVFRVRWIENILKKHKMAFGFPRKWILSRA